MNTTPTSPQSSETEGRSSTETTLETGETADQRMKGPLLLVALTATYVFLQVLALNVYPLEAWTQRILHMAGGLALGAIIYSTTRRGHGPAQGWAQALGVLTLLLTLASGTTFALIDKSTLDVPGMNAFSWALALATLVTIPATWIDRKSTRLNSSHQ